MRESVLYVNELKKQSILQITLENIEREKEEEREKKEFIIQNIESMKRQAKEIDMPLEFQDSPSNYSERSNNRLKDGS